MRTNHVLFDIQHELQQRPVQEDPSGAAVTSKSVPFGGQANAAIQGPTVGREKAEFLTVQQVAVLLGVTRNWVYTHADDLGAYRLGKYLRFSWPRVVERLEKTK
ncbi:MAG TPA: helix-turn-helix domain-containing protein [Candidatus Eisenbacteria bacterium]|nr:helix-turn-helix domain-containing protein [Candidatus Eisenbacteria bacterium]